MEELRIRLQRLLPAAEVQISRLSGGELADYQYLLQHLRMIYGTQGYTEYLAMIREIFGDRESKPGTVAGYFNGCLLQGSCKIDPVDYKILEGKWNNGYKFFVVRKTSSRMGILYLDQYHGGLNEAEISWLQEHGLDAVQLKSALGHQYTIFLPLASIPRRQQVLPNHDGKIFAALSFLAIILLLMILLILRR